MTEVLSETLSSAEHRASDILLLLIFNWPNLS